MRPAPGMAPTRAWVSAKRARSEAIRKSQDRQSSRPPVTAGPLTAPITGVVVRRQEPQWPTRDAGRPAP